jgi:cytoskeleton protein RodZ
MANEVQRILHPQPETPEFAEAEKPAASPIQLPRVEQWETVGDSHRFQFSSPLPALALVVVVMLGCAGVYSLWQRNRHPVLAHPSAVAPAAAPPAVAQQPPPQPAPAPAQPAGQAQANPAPVSPTAPETAAATPAPGVKPPASPADAPAAARLPAPNPNAPVRVELTAGEAVWVLVRSDGKYLFSGTLEPNQTRTVEANSTVFLRLGNAGGVNITLNGKPIGTVGPKGQVRTVQFTSGGFEIVAVPKPPSAPLDPR